MNTRLTTIAALLLAGTGIAGGLAATAASDTGAERAAAQNAKAAAKGLAKHRVDKAVIAAEAAVALAPRVAAYRTLLGQAYLAAGRFGSATAALTDAVALDAADGNAALHLALAQVASGDWSGAKATLAAHEGQIPASDRGLALALAGDPASAVVILTAAARDPNADAKTRQNLALALGLAGRWQEAKTVAALDVSPADLDARMMQWIAFAQPRAASDQISTLLGVMPVVDPGQPQRLALREPTNGVAAVVQPVAAAVAYVAAQTAAPEAEAVTETTLTVAKEAPTAAAPIALGPRFEVVQSVAKPVMHTTRVAMPAPTSRPRFVPAAKPTAVKPMASGVFYVQLGAFQNAGVAHDAWGRLSRRASLNRMVPQGGTVKRGEQTLYRLSVGGFARADADRLCGSLRASGTRCFVRAGAGDAVAQWARPGVQVASR